MKPRQQPITSPALKLMSKQFDFDTLRVMVVCPGRAPEERSLFIHGAPLTGWKLDETNAQTGKFLRRHMCSIVQVLS